MLITSLKNADSFYQFLNNIIWSYSPDNFIIKIDKFIDLIDYKDYIIIPHYFKSNSLNDDDIQYLINGVGKYMASCNNWTILYFWIKYKKTPYILKWR